MIAIYVYVDWTVEKNPKVFYVGKGDKRRARLLIRNKKHSNVSLKHGINREIVLITSIDRIALDHEIDLVAFHKTYHYDDPNVIGCNFTRGGEGMSGHKLSIEMKQRLSALNRGKVPWNKGLFTGPRSLETRSKIAKSHFGMKASAETRKKLSESHMGLPSPRKGKKTGKPSWNSKRVK